MAKPAYLTFLVAGQAYALPAAEVAEIFILPGIARLPLSPAALLGMANLRGTAIPVASLRALLGHAPAPATGRAILLDGPAPVALAIDSIAALATPDTVQTSQAELAAQPGAPLRGAFQAATGPTKILDIQAMLALAFAPRPAKTRQAALARTPTAATEAAQTLPLLSFTIAGQDYALPLSALREIIPLPPGPTESLIKYQGGLLPVLALRALLGFPPQAPDGCCKIIVTQVAGLAVGLAADRVREVLHAEPARIEPAPALLAARAGGESRIIAIYRGAQRLVSILAPEKLFAEDVMHRLGFAPAALPPAPATALARYLVFHLGADAYGLPVAAVEEVAAVPATLTRLPKTPEFLAGVINLRGEVLPVIDQRRRFGLPECAGNPRRRLIVLRGAHHRAGMIVDAVSEVLSAPTDAISPAPALAGETTSLVEAVLNLEGRIILLLNPDELLTRTEQNILEESSAFLKKSAQKTFAP